MKRHLQSFDASLPACPCTSKARARIGQPKYQEQSINLNQVRQNATRHLPEEKCSQVLGLIESTLWFSGHRLACGLIITSTQALLSKTSRQSATALPQPGSITDHISLKHPEKTWKDICNPSMNLRVHVHAPARLYIRIYNLKRTTPISRTVNQSEQSQAECNTSFARRKVLSGVRTHRIHTLIQWT